jgi:endonuclease IV
VDFGHLYARTHGGITCREDYAKMLDLIADKLGTERLNSMHIHFSRIEFTAGGEKRHLTFEDTQFGPEYQPLMQEIKQRGMTPSIICESAGTQAEDAAEMKRYYESL